MRHCYVRWNKTAGIYKQTMGRVTELQSFFISRQKMTSVHAINHGALKWQISQSKWNYLGARAGGFFQGRAHILSSKICPKQVTQTPSNKHTHTHIYTHTIKAVFQFHRQWFSVLSSIHLITRQIQSVVTAHIKSQPGLATACIPLPLWKFLEAILRQVSSGCMCDRSVLFVCGSLFGSQQRCWSGRVSAWQSTGTRLHGSDQ